MADRRGQTEASFQFAVRDGATSRATHHLRRFASESRRRFEEMERGMLELVLAQGAAVIEWAQLSLQDPPPAVQSNWDVVRGQLANGRTFLCVEEIQQAVPLPSHIFVLIAAAENAHLDTVGLDPWTLEQIGVVAIVVNIPLQGHAIPTLPNPVRPDFLTGEQADQGRPPQDPMNIAESYGFTRATVEVGDTVMLYPPNDFGLYPHAVEQAKRLSLSPPKQPNGPHWMILLNNYWLKSTRSQSVATYLSRSTRIFAMGPDFDIPISQWGLREIWKKGGLVTFSPTLLLREPQRFAEIMEVIRVTPGWAAYIPPSTVLWCEESWHNRTRCPQSSMAFAALTSALFMDDQIMQLAGALQDDMGGLAVSYCPPHLAQREQCAKWIDWLRRVFQCDDYEALLKLCSEGYKAQAQAKQHRGSGSGSGPSQPAPLNLLDVEMNIVGDLVDMRQRPHIVPYRRFIYVGALSNRAEINRYYEKAVEFVDPQDFVAFLSGVS